MARAMPRPGWRDYEKQKGGPPWRGILIFVLVSTCGGLGATLYSARLAHGTLWERFQVERGENFKLQQNVARSKVEVVEANMRESETAQERNRVKNELQTTKDKLTQAQTEIQTLNNKIQQLTDNLAAAEEKVSQGEMATAELERKLADRQSELDSLQKKLAVLEHHIAGFTQNDVANKSSFGDVDRNPDERQAHLQHGTEGGHIQVQREGIGRNEDVFT